MVKSEDFSVEYTQYKIERSFCEWQLTLTSSPNDKTEATSRY